MQAILTGAHDNSIGCREKPKNTETRGKFRETDNLVKVKCLRQWSVFTYLWEI